MVLGDALIISPDEVATLQLSTTALTRRDACVPLLFVRLCIQSSDVSQILSCATFNMDSGGLVCSLPCFPSG